MRNSEIRRPIGRAKGRPLDPSAREAVLALLGNLPRRPDLLVEYLHLIQDSQGCLPVEMLTALAEELRMAQTEVFEVATFYHHFDVVKEAETRPPALTIRVCDSGPCAMAGAEALLPALQQYADRLPVPPRIQRVPCIGRCAEAPAVVVHQYPIAPATVQAVDEAVRGNRRDCPLPPDALRLESAMAEGGYAVLRKLLAAPRTTESFEEMCAQLQAAGLRGLGGAGFPAGRKWQIVSQQAGDRILVVNADEGEPGTFKDRHYLERRPHQFLEGMLIAAWAVDCRSCYIYLRDEYPGIRHLLQAEIVALQAAASAFASADGWQLPEIHLRRGAGAYICGEESAMLESIEGKRGMPRLRPPYIAEVGLFDRPTLAHNVETLYWIPEILSRGADWFASHGRRGRKGLRSFSVSGRVADPGVKLAPAGISLRELVDEYCGGMAPGHELYGYLPGGASGGILPASLADEPLDFDTLQKHGCFIGSAAVIVLSQHDRARDVAHNMMAFFRHESCGQCTPCRSGTAKAVHLMQAPAWDADLMQDLSVVMIDASICGLGQAAPNPMLSVLKHFPKEVASEGVEILNPESNR
ncbi:MAG TPA: NADH-ubiquinone oxidoreductase-F iron-sulfur binding region domain-containing protein [Lautropia sp.]|nr:NADH-ubiquinone oxidoreductase-F iron-sulfur binding region domain-containing protein [Lautropia sp.]